MGVEKDQTGVYADRYKYKSADEGDLIYHHECHRYLYNSDDLQDWLASDAGTVAMIEKLRCYSARARQRLLEAIKSENLNAALQAAILEIKRNG